jgi:hypothetical protein
MEPPSIPVRFSSPVAAGAGYESLDLNLKLVGEAGFEPATPWPPAKQQPSLVIPDCPGETPAVLDPERSHLRPSLPFP